MASLSMSMMLSERSGNADWTIKPSVPSTWIPDERVKRCYGCGVVFSTFRRKHHCRSCGRIFCSACTAYRELIPSYYHTFSGVSITQPQRTCAPCTQSLQRASEVEHLIRMISMLPVEMTTLFGMRLVNKQWNHATNTMFSIFRGLQYKLSCQAYSTLECDFLRTHYKEFHGHISWQVHTLVSMYQRGEQWHRKHPCTFVVPCRKLLCSRTCSPHLSVEDVLRLGMTDCLEKSSVQHWVIDAWKNMAPDTMMKMMSWWVFFGCKFHTLFKHGLIPAASQRKDLTYALWFECELQKTPRLAHTLTRAQKTLLSAVPAETRKQVSMSQKLARCLTSIIQAPSKERRAELAARFFKDDEPVRLPWNVNIAVVSMTVAKQLASSSKPLVVEMRSCDGQCHTILLKREDVRTDRTAMTIGYWINKIAPEVYVYTYDIFPLTDQCGVVQMIPRTKTIYAIRNSNISLLNYIMTSNEVLSVKELRKRVVKSTAGACLLAFTMGLGDRHLENILVSSDGLLVHVDFGYVLGDDPKHQRTQMRLTEDMIDAMGGKTSATFASFVHTTQHAYGLMRLHTSFWYHLMVSECFIVGDKRRHWKRIRDHTLDRFVPGEASDEASVQIEAVVEKATEETWFQSFVDMTHSASNQMTGIFHMEL